jgi:hypothetical protein
VDVEFRGGRCQLALPLPEGASGPVELLLGGPPRARAVLKLAAAADGPAIRDVRPDAPGYDVLRVPDGVPEGTRIARSTGVPLAEGRYTVEVLDARGRPVPAGRLVIAWPDGRRVDAAGAGFEAAGPETLSFVCELLHGGGAGLVLDQVRLHHSEPWVYDLGVTR